jgi:hypothetical protein
MMGVTWESWPGLQSRPKLSKSSRVYVSTATACKQNKFLQAPLPH